MNKTETIARLNELGALLGRDINTTGTVAELEILLREAEAEYEAENEENNENDTGGTDPIIDPGSSGASADDGPDALMLVEVLVTLHINALHATNPSRLSIVRPGTAVRLPVAEADEMIRAGYVRRVE